MKSAVGSAGAIVAAQNRLAAAAGARVLAAGGNAVDAAVVTGFALGVLEPWMSGIGGGGIMVVAQADGSPVEVVDGAMVAPVALDPAEYPPGLRSRTTATSRGSIPPPCCASEPMAATSAWRTLPRPGRARSRNRVDRAWRTGV